MNDRLIQALKERSNHLTKRVVSEMYQNPFWEARYGARGRLRAEQDGEYHLSYLTEALASNSAEIMPRYARWLQSVLISRGMCSRHIAENFQRLEVAIVEHVPDAQPAAAMLRSARQALLYEAGTARELQDVSDAAADAVATALRIEGPQSQLYRDHALYCLSYLADAIAAGRNELFSNYVTWVRGALQPGHAPGSQMVDLVIWLGKYLTDEARISAQAGACVHQAMAAARSGLAYENGKLANEAMRR